jgi:hypothetical protein
MGSRYRNTVLQWLKDQNRAVPPEIGLDVELIARVCNYMNNRETRYLLLFLVAGTVALITSVIDTMLAVIFLTAGSAAIYFRKVYQERYDFAAKFQRDMFDSQRVSSEFRVDLDREHRSGLPKHGQNLVVYKGFTPFIGAGSDLGGWSFTVATDKPKESFGRNPEPKRFTVGELYDAVDRSIAALGLDGLYCQEYYFVNGADIREDRTLLPDPNGRPVQVLESELSARYRLGSDSRVRQYKWIRIHDWGNELVLSFFLRCCLRGNSLFVELKRFLLTPISDTYREVDKIPLLSWRSMFTLLLSSAIVGPFYAVFSPIRLLNKLSEQLQTLFGAEQRRRCKEIEDNPLFNYGADSSIRQQFSSGQFLHYFQKIDGDFYIKVLEREILDEIVNFLEDHNIDTYDIKERQTTILNSGIIVHGGDVKAESLAVGAGAQSTKRVERAAQRRVLRKAAAA